MHSLPCDIYSVGSIREIDRCAIEGHDIPGYTLMTRAGAAAVHLEDHPVSCEALVGEEEQHTVAASGERVPALRVGPVVRTRDQATVEGQGDPCPIL